MSLSEAKTYIYIDVSNIRHACLWSCGFNLDFIKLYNYLKEKYPNVQEIRYYEGISSTDKKKLKHFRFLSEKIGYKICSLTRKGYVEPPKYEIFECENCKFPNKVKVLPESVKLKSNVDVYLASDLLECVARAKEPINVVILSCDGDYAEAIKATLRLSPKSCVTVLATPRAIRRICGDKKEDRNPLKSSHPPFLAGPHEDSTEVVSPTLELSLLYFYSTIR